MDCCEETSTASYFESTIYDDEFNDVAVVKVLCNAYYAANWNTQL